MAKKLKSSFWETFKASDKGILDCLNRCGCLQDFTKDEGQVIERFICQVYLSGIKVSNIGPLRWHMLSKKKKKKNKQKKERKKEHDVKNFPPKNQL